MTNKETGSNFITEVVAQVPGCEEHSGFPEWKNEVGRGKTEIKPIEAIFNAVPLEQKTRIMTELLAFMQERRNADMAVNQFYWDLTHGDSECGHLLFEKMEDPNNNDHNRNHLRRLEEYVELALESLKWKLLGDVIAEQDLKTEPFGIQTAKSLLTCVYIAIQFHDAPQLLSGKKEGHGELAALWIMAMVPEIAQSMNISVEEAERYARGAAFIVAKHESLAPYINKDPSIEALSPQALRNQLGDDWKTYMPVEFVTKFGQRIDEISINTVRFSDYFNSEEILAAYYLGALFGWSDKVETAWPGDLGLARTFLAKISRKRPFYYSERPRNQDGQLMTPQEELDLIIKTKGVGIGLNHFNSLNMHDYEEQLQEKFTNDVWRKLYELNREFPSDILPDLTMNNMICATRDARDLVIDLMSGNYDKLFQVFEERMRQLANKLMLRNNIPPELARQIADARHVQDVTPQHLNLTNGDAERYRKTMDGIQTELDQIKVALGVGTDRCKVREYDDELIQHVRAMFDLTLQRLCEKANIPFDEVSSLVPEYPFRGYDSAAKPDEMRRMPRQ